MKYSGGVEGVRSSVHWDRAVFVAFFYKERRNRGGVPVFVGVG